MFKYNLTAAFFLITLTLALALNFSGINQVKADTGTILDKVKQGGLDQVGQAYPQSGTPQDIRFTIINIINIFLSLLGIISLVIIIYGGFRWMTAAGNEENVAAAKKILIAGIIGLVIILASYAIANFVISRILGAVTGTNVNNLYNDQDLNAIKGY